MNYQNQPTTNLSLFNRNSLHNIFSSYIRRNKGFQICGITLISIPAACDMTNFPRHDYFIYQNPASPSMEAMLNMWSHIIGYLMFGFWSTWFALMKSMPFNPRG